MADLDDRTAFRRPSDVAPSDDTGSVTAIRYRYQDQIAAAHALSMLHRGGLRLICE